MRAQPVDLIGGFYTDDTLPWACQDTLNWLPFRAEVAGTRTAWKLATAPGLKPYLQVGQGPIRGMHDLEGGRYVVSGQTLCRINPNGTVVPLGTIPGVGRVSMSHNQFSTGYQLLVENGEGGGGYAYTTSTGVFAKITDPAYPGSISSDYLDSYMLGVEPLGRFWFHSNLADATDYNSLDRYESEASPDRIVGLAVSGSEVVVFNQRTIEFFYNAGAATGTFQNRRQPIARGCASRHTIAKLDNTLMWLADDGVVYRLNGYSAVPLSTRVMDRAIAGFNWAEAFAFTWEDRGFKVYCLTFPNGLTFCYDVVSGLWTRRGSYGMDRWRLSHAIKWGGTWYGGDFREGRLWEIAWGYYLEGRDPLVRRRVSPVLADNQSMVVIPSAELVFGTGEGPETVPVDFPTELELTGLPPSTLVGLTYPAFSFGVIGGTGPYNFFLTNGGLPPGLSMNSAGAISGSSTAGGLYRFTVRVFDSKLAWTEREYSINSEAQLLGLAIPQTLFTGGYENLSAYAALSSLTPNGDGAFGISPSTVYAAVGALNSPFLQLYKLNPSVSTYAVSTDIDVVPTTSVRSIAFHPDGVHLAICYTVSSVIRINMYKFESGQYKFKSFFVIAAGGLRIGWSPTGEFLTCSVATGSPDFGFKVIRFDAGTSTLVSSFSPASGQNVQAPEGFSWSRDGKYLAEWSNNKLNVWEVTPSSVIFRSGAAPGSVASGRGAHFSDDGNFIYVLDGGLAPRMAVFPVNAGVLGAQTIPASQPPDNVSDSAFSAGYLAVGKNSNTGGIPQIVVYKCNGTSVVPTASQPTGMHPTQLVPAIRWTI
jgi:WD40 repeat protein